MKQRENSAAGMVVGIAAGAALGLPVMMATQSKRQYAPQRAQGDEGCGKRGDAAG